MITCWHYVNVINYAVTKVCTHDFMRVVAHSLSPPQVLRFSPLKQLFGVAIAKQMIRCCHYVKLCFHQGVYD